MDSNYDRTTAVEERNPVAISDGEEKQRELGESAIGQIKEAERVSAFGRFALKVQNFFQHPKRSRVGPSASWRATPTVLLLVASLLVVFTLLFLVSKPEGKSGRYFRQTGSLVGPDDNQSLPAPSFSPPPLNENQLVGGEAEPTRPQPAKRAAAVAPSADGISSVAPPPSNKPTPEELLFSNGGQPGNGLQSPATVFVANSTPADQRRTPALKEASAMPNGQLLEVQLPVGTEIVVHTTNAISSGLESPVVAIVDQDVKSNRTMFIPQGTRAIGFTAGAVKNRVNLRFTSLVLPDERQIDFSGLALMEDGSAGLEGKAKGSGHSVLAGAGRVATGAAVLATQFAGQSSASLNRPFSQADLLRNQLAAEIATEGNRMSNRLDRPLNIPIISVPTNRRIRIFLLAPIRLEKGQLQIAKPAEPSRSSTDRAKETGDPSADSLVTLQADYIQALETQVAELRAALAKQQRNGPR